ncbi:MAG: GNAT family N-acetyltransferase [Roseiflexaceae bacterium]
MMYPPLTDMASEPVIRAIEENAAEFLLALGRAAGSEERNDSSIQWTIGGSPIDYHNCVVRANLTPETADQAIQAVLARLRAYNVPGSWHLGPAMRPADLGPRLLAHGFSYAGPEPGMAINLSELDQAARPAGVTIERVMDSQALVMWVDTLGQGFGEGPREAGWVGAMYARIGLGDATPWRHYLAYSNGMPVATASLFLGAGVAGIYFVFTIDFARRRGIGAAITAAALRDARELGYRIGVLGASDMGYGVYRRLGFREYCTIDIYEWRPH